jgi:hypothetical protein
MILCSSLKIVGSPKPRTPLPMREQKSHASPHRRSLTGSDAINGRDAFLKLFAATICAALVSDFIFP